MNRISTEWHKIYGKLSLRESLLLAVVAWAAVLLWTSGLWNHYGTLLAQLNTTQNTLADQRRILSKESQIEDAYASTWEALNTERTYTASELSAKVDTLARNHQLNYTAATPRSLPHGLLQLHTMNISIRNADMANLIQFHEALAQETPYLAIRKISINSARKDIRLNVSLVLRAFERRKQTSPAS